MKFQVWPRQTGGMLYFSNGEQVSVHRAGPMTIEIDEEAIASIHGICIDSVSELELTINTLIAEACNARKVQKAIGDVAGSAFVVFPDPETKRPKEMDTLDPEAESSFYEQYTPRVQHKPFQGFEPNSKQVATT